MATQYPYVSGAGALVKTFDQLRKNPPQTLDAAWFKRFGIAPANESYVISILRFIGLYDDEGQLVEGNRDFLYGDDKKFQSGLEAHIKTAYKPLFDDHGNDAWAEARETLTTWFRAVDRSSDVTGHRQAQTFLNLAALAGHGPVPSVSSSGNRTQKSAPPSPAKKATKAPTTKSSSGEKSAEVVPAASAPSSDFGLSVKIEVNLPADGTPETYDSIFASIRKHLIDRG